jgi:hypothetical protein
MKYFQLLPKDLPHVAIYITTNDECTISHKWLWVDDETGEIELTEANKPITIDVDKVSLLQAPECNRILSGLVDTKEITEEQYYSLFGVVPKKTKTNIFKRFLERRKAKKEAKQRELHRQAKNYISDAFPL